MRFVKFVLLVLFFLFFMVFFVQNQAQLSTMLELKFHMFTLNWEAQPLPFYLLVLIFFVLGALFSTIFFVIDPSQFRKPVLGWILRLMKAIPAGDGDRTRAAVQRALDAGDLVAVFPEGRPGAEGHLGAFEAPLAELLAAVQVPVLPVALAGLQSSLFSRVPAARRTGALLAHVSLRVGDPLVPQAAPDALREAMEVLL